MPESRACRRLCNDVAVLQRTVELYLQLLHQFPAALPALLEETGLMGRLVQQAQADHTVPSHLPQPAGQAAPPGQRVAQAAAPGGARTGNGGGPPSQAQAALLLQFDLQLLGLLVQRSSGQQLQQQLQQGRGGGAAGLPAGMPQGFVAALPAAWALLYWLAAPSGGCWVPTTLLCCTTHWVALYRMRLVCSTSEACPEASTLPYTHAPALGLLQGRC